MTFHEWIQTRRPTWSARGDAVRTLQFWIEDGLLPEIESAEQLTDYAKSQGTGEIAIWAMGRLFEEWKRTT
ncbi:MAG: hypothetical protein AAGB51_13975 [Planctomycetota bacterium]